MRKNPGRKDTRKHTKGKGDLNRKTTHKMRTNMGMSVGKEAE